MLERKRCRRKLWFCLQPANQEPSHTTELSRVKSRVSRQKTINIERCF